MSRRFGWLFFVISSSYPRTNPSKKNFHISSMQKAEATPANSVSVNSVNGTRKRDKGAIQGCCSHVSLSYWPRYRVEAAGFLRCQETSARMSYC
ncbi:hypothetical protein AVEN_58918-1 [Araneus ventricosus]|uniref:Uncharacterized protein n=1 Tax=Araneus ventricosus TaxID=182803 RepID=A0A4Y2EQJ7_ARAVE|nr:hypothetical protein AVEN_58918-1 [Araneus ventricosus]